MRRKERFNKKHFLIAIITILISATLGLTCFLFYDRINNQIPIIDGMFFNMSPKQAEKILGKHFEMECDIDVTGKYIYSYKATVLDKEATVICFFVNDKKLTDMYIRWDSDFDGIRAQARDCIYDYYHKHRYFFERQSTPVSSVETCISMGIDNGNIGTFYDIYETHELLSISCIYLR